MQKRSRRITDVANSMLGLRWCIGGQDIRRVTRNVACRVVRMHDYLRRAEALEAAGASSVAWD
jgi:hypothetical protein